MQPISVTILTGFLGSGKTTLLKRVLSEAHGQKIAVIENEFGAENIDNDILIAENEEQIIQMSNGCICCSIREDLRSTLMNLAAQKYAGSLDFDRVIIETTGLADPGPIAQTFFMDEEVAQSYTLDSIITLVDALHASQQLDARQEARRQVGFADQIFISKADLVTEPVVEKLMQRLQQINPRAPIEQANFGVVALDKILDLRGFNLDAKLDLDPAFLPTEANASACCEHEHAPGQCSTSGSHHHIDDDVKSFVYKSSRPFDPVRLEDFFGALVQVYGPNMLRYKGVLYMQGTERKVIFQGVHQVMGTDLGPAWRQDEEKLSKMVFIGINLPQKTLLEGLEQALA